MSTSPTALRLAVVGGGSTYTPELADGLGRMADLLPVEELVLVDTDLGRTRIVAGLCQRILAAHGSPCRVTVTDDLETAVDGATAVLLQLRVGGQGARARDESWPLECGCIGQETTGAGGLAKAMRTVPVVLDIARRVREVNPGAWLVNFTNPVGIVTRALLDDGHRSIGLCNVAIGLQRYFAGLLEVGADEIQLDHVGLNHLSWETEVYRTTPDGGREPVLGELLDRFGAQIAEEVELPHAVLALERTVPSYYLRYFYLHDELVREALDRPSRAQEVAAIEAELLDLYADERLTAKPQLLEQRGGAYYSEAAIGLLGDLVGAGGGRHVVNVRNAGTLDLLPDDAVVEVACQVGPDGARPLPVAPLPPLAAGLVAHASRYEELALDAARLGGRDRVLRALLAHPLVGQIDAAQRLTDTLLAENRQFLAWAR